MRIIIVDGHPVTRAGLKSILEAERDLRIVGEAGSGEEALRLVAEAEPDLVLLGLDLAEEPDGVEVCRRLKSWSDPPYVLIFTAYDLGEVISACFVAGADSYLHRRAANEALVNTVRRTVSGQRVWDVKEQVGEAGSVVHASPTGARLTSRELEVLGLKLRRRTNAEIGRALHISLDTVKHHVSSIYRKLGKVPETSSGLDPDSDGTRSTRDAPRGKWHLSGDAHRIRARS